MASLASEQQSVIEQLAERIVRSAPNLESVWQINGSAGVGKTTILRRTAGTLRDRGLVALLVSAPEGELDAGAFALVQVAAGLKAAGFIDGQVDLLRDPSVPSSEKLTRVQGWVEEHHDDVVLLCDEPTSWYDERSETFPTASDRLTRDLVGWVVHAAPCRRVITGPSPDLDHPLPWFTAPRVEDTEGFLRDGPIWGDLASMAESLIAGCQNLRGATPLLLRLLVGLASVRSADWVVERLRVLGAEEKVIDILLDELAAQPQDRDVCRELTRLVAVRGPIPPQWLDQLAEGLTPRQRDLIARCLMVGEGCEAELHPLVRRKVGERIGNQPWTLAASQLTQIHEELARYYADVAEGSPSSLSGRMEEFHHRFRIGKAGHPVGGAPFFPEQLRAAGRYLSYVAHRHGDAAAVFRLCLSYDARDDYAHHYLAYNLDWQAADPEGVEEHYRRTLELNPRHPWWWSRWITYLITRGRTREAKREWHRALDALSISGLDTSRERAIARSLHRWVARWLLHWSQLDFAEIVLDSVPPSYRDDDSGLRALDGLLRSLREAERAHAVFPLSIPPESWWTPEPHLVFPREWDGRPLAAWRPARVQAVGDDLVELVVGEPPSDASALPRHGLFTFRIEEIEAAGLPRAALRAGRFLELAFYGDDGAMRIGAHDDAPWRDPDLPPLYPSPDRWVRRLTAG